MNVAQLKVSGFLKTSLEEIASAVERSKLLIPNPFSLKTVNNFNSIVATIWVEGHFKLF